MRRGSWWRSIVVLWRDMKKGKIARATEVLNFGEKGRGRNIREIIVERGEPVVFYDVWTKNKLEEWLIK